MRFVDQCKVKVVAGDGGNGAAAFRREKFVPFGGPSGGDGGRGASVVFVGDEGMSTLLDFTHSRLLQGARGEHGHGSDCHGRGGEDREEHVPIGTQIRDATTGELIADVTAHGQRVVVAQGGRGGRGNIHFATPHDRAPRRAEKGEPGEVREIELELKIMADVGLLGFPNVGKSTFVASVSAARPRVADYPFTTLVPTLGVVAVGGGRNAGGTSFVIADIPGLIPGASEGVGLGIQFLKHVERTRALLHLVSLDPGEGREPLADYRALRRELEQFSPELAERPEIVALSKADVTEVREEYEALAARFWDEERVKLRLVSAATKAGIDELLRDLYRIVQGEPSEDDLPAARAAFMAARKAAAKKARAAAKKAAAPKTKATSTRAKATPTRAKATSAKAKATSTRAKATSTRAKATSTRAKATSTRAKATPTRGKATSTRAKATSTKAKVTSTRGKATPTKAKATSTSAKATSTRAKATSTRAKATSTRGKATPTKAKATSTRGKATSTRGKASPARKAVAPKRKVAVTKKVVTRGKAGATAKKSAKRKAR